MKPLKKYRRLLWLLGVFKIPMVGFVRPKLIELTNEKAVITIRTRRRTKNHLNSMYFGALAVGADLAAGLPVVAHCDLENVKPSLAFKSLSGNFLKRAEGTISFTCSEGLAIQEKVRLAKSSGERQNWPVKVVATNEQHEIVAEFIMECSVKVTAN